jgi:outer membrane receptor protein involved in Fe transport
MTAFRLLSTTALAGMALTVPHFALAQSAPKEPAAPTNEVSPDAGSAIVVTGSRINRANLDSAVPITVITSTDVLATGNLSLGDNLNQLPQLRASLTQANSQGAIGRSGINALDLRGLGTSRTLVLVDGRRIITSTPGINRPDVNNIPEGLIDRIDIVTGGNSAIYGSDAVAGVVNFVLKQNFEGLRIRAQSGISSRGDRGSYTGSITGGHNFADGRGNFSFSAEYTRQNTLTNTDRNDQTGAYTGTSAFANTENTGANLNPSAGPLHGVEPSTGNGIPDTTFLTGLRFNAISEGGLFTASCPVAAAAGESAAAFATRRGLACSGLPNPGSSNPLSQFGNTFVFNPDGTLGSSNCITDLRPFGSSSCVGGKASTLRLTGYLEPGITRKAFNFMTHFEVSPAFVPYFSAQFVRVNANQEGQPTFFNNTFSLDNPYLTAQARSTLVSVLAPGATTFSAFRFNIDFGGRGEDHRRDNISAVAGVKGTFFDGWKYDVSASYGHLYTFYQTAGNVNRAKYANSIAAVRNAAGNIVCAINADAITTNDDPSCVPVNLFGDGQVSQAAIGYFGYTSQRVQKANLYDGSAYIAGDLSHLFKLPGGPVAFVLGGEIRRETAFAAYDPFTVTGGTFLNSIPDFRPPAQVVKEAFGEISVPILKGMPFAYELTLDGAGRVSNYNIGKTGTVYTYNVNGIYAPFRDLKFRVGYARAVRAPTQSDLYSPLSQTFLNGLVDPCGQQNINNNPNRVKNCAAAGVPTTQTFNGTTEPFSNRPSSGISGFNGSNPLLNAETSTSLTAGAVFQPHFIPGLTMSVDYYRIEVKNVIFSLAAQTIINQCYDNPSGIANPFCSSVFRNPNGTFLGQSDVSHGGTSVSLTPTGASFISGPFNFAKQITSGIDTDVSYRHNFGGNNAINMRAIVTHTFIRNNFTDVTDPNFAQRQLSVLGDPEWQGQLSANLIHGAFNFGYRMRYIGKQLVSSSYATQNPFQGRPATNPDAFPFLYYSPVTYHDFRLDMTPAKSNFNFYIGVDNAFDKLPQYDLQGTEAGNPFSPVGRFFYAGAEIKF